MTTPAPQFVTLTVTGGETYLAQYDANGLPFVVIGRTAREFVKTKSGDYVAVEEVTHIAGLDEARKAIEEQTPDPPAPVKHAYQFERTGPEENEGICSCACGWVAHEGLEVTEADAGVYYAQHIEDLGLTSSEIDKRDPGALGGTASECTCPLNRRERFGIMQHDIDCPAMSV